MADCEDLTNITSWNCSMVSRYSNCTTTGDICSATGGVCRSEPDLTKGVTIVLVFVISLIGNTCTILILSQFKIHKIPDVLVVGLALTDLLATILPVPAAMYSYFSGDDFISGCVLCNFMGTIAHFTRYSSAIIVSLVSFERYLAVNRPFLYRKYATPKRFVVIMIICWLFALALAAVPLIGNNTRIQSNDGVCLFDLTSNYAIGILVFSVIQYVIVCTCFVLVSVELCKVYRRRKKLKIQGRYNSSSKARSRQTELTFTRPNFTSRISDLGKSIKAAAPILTERFQLSVEAQFARMLFAVVALFYITWTTIVVVIIIAEIQKDFSGLDQALFWGLRFTVISTAINPFLYGILARQYRLAYYYVIRLWFSKCCPCVDPPLKDVFAAARHIGGDVHETRRNSQQSRRTTNSAGSRFSKPKNVLLTNTSNLMLGLGLPPKLSEIHEEMSLEPNESSIAAEFSTHIQTAGELSSSVTIPMQARDHNDSSTVDLELRGAASMHDLMEAGMVELGNTANPHNGIQNPLAMITRMVGGEEVIISPGESLESSEAHTEFLASPQFSNPVYELNNTSQSRDQIEAQIARRQMMLAASSTDDITLISKKTKVSKTRSNDDTPNRYSDPNLPPGISSLRNRGLKVPLALVSRGKRQADKTLQDEKKSSHQGRGRRKSGGMVVEATDIDTGESVLVASRDNIDYKPPSHSTVPNHSSAGHRASSSSPSRTVTPRLNAVQAHTHSRSFDNALWDPEAEVQHKRNTKYQLSKRQQIMHSLDAQPTPPLGSMHSNKTKQTGVRRNNSMDNSDSGHESMVMDSDPLGLQAGQV